MEGVDSQVAFFVDHPQSPLLHHHAAGPDADDLPIFQLMLPDESPVDVGTRGAAKILEVDVGPAPHDLCVGPRHLGMMQGDVGIVASAQNESPSGGHFKVRGPAYRRSGRRVAAPADALGAAQPGRTNRVRISELECDRAPDLDHVAVRKRHVLNRPALETQTVRAAQISDLPP